MALAAQKTLGELITDMRFLLGFGAQQDVSYFQKELFTRFLQSAQDELLLQFGDMLRLRVNESAITTVASDSLYDIPSDCDPYKIVSVSVKDSGDWDPMQQGLGMHHRDDNDAESIPSRYDIRYDATAANTQIEVWPVPDGVYTIGMEYYMVESAFSQSGDTASIDHRLLLLFAMAAAKAHYNHQDKAEYASRTDSALRRLRAAQHGNQRYFKKPFTCGGSKKLTSNINIEHVVGTAIIDDDYIVSETGDFIVQE